MDSEEKNLSKELNKEDTLKWENKKKNNGILDLLQPIVGNFILLIEEERKRTLDQRDKANKMLERMKNNT